MRLLAASIAIVFKFLCASGFQSTKKNAFPAKCHFNNFKPLRLSNSDVESEGDKIHSKPFKFIRQIFEDSALYTSASVGLNFEARIPRKKEPPIQCKLFENKSEDLKKKVLILMSDTGGGHRASAEALKAAFDKIYPNLIEVSIVDIWTEYGVYPFNKFVESYQFMARRPPLWKMFWEYGKYPLTRLGTEIWSNFFCFKNFEKCIKSEAPDLVISVHPLCQKIPMKILRKIKREKNLKRQIPFVTVVTDLGGAHPTWFDPCADKIFVPSEVLKSLALKRNVDNERVVMHGLPTRPGFWEPSSPNKKNILRKKLGLKAGLKSCLVVGGGDGVGNLALIAEALAKKLDQCEGSQQLIVVCGKNEKIREKLLEIKVSDSLDLKILGFVHNMDEWMGAVDVIVTKAGPGTIAEATIQGLPIMLSSFLPGQEEGNIPYVVEGGYGSYSKDPEEIATTVKSWLLDDEKLSKMSANAKKAARPNATTAIARDIAELLYAPYEPPTEVEINRFEERKEENNDIIT